ncbi:MAG TPA: hypothetical protein VEZ12_10170, partial [Herpetosiphonaceae bacterium]|nr:hypothetical protein [Herpetosiphonaceae bacterium]
MRHSHDRADQRPSVSEYDIHTRKCVPVGMLQEAVAHHHIRLLSNFRDQGRKGHGFLLNKHDSTGEWQRD